jgi:hypothetical protein
MYVSRFRFLALPLSMRALVALIAAFGWVPASESASFAIGSCANEYRQCLEKWKVDRVAYLKSEEGYLNLVGLFWLGQGQSTFGSDAGWCSPEQRWRRWVPSNSARMVSPCTCDPERTFAWTVNR